MEAAAPPSPAAPAAAFDVEAPRPASLRPPRRRQGDDAAQAVPANKAQQRGGSPLSARGEAWRDVGEAVGLATWTAATALDVALAVMLLSNGAFGLGAREGGAM
jgi:hypothetical protein